jgi:hypothetical protein
MPRHNLQPAELATRIVQGHVLYSHVVVVEGRRTIFRPSLEKIRSIYRCL